MPPVPSHPPMDTTQNYIKEGSTILFAGKLTHGGVTVPSLTPLLTPLTPLLLHFYICSTIFGKYQYFISLTFSLGPDETPTVWWLQNLD